MSIRGCYGSGLSGGRLPETVNRATQNLGRGPYCRGPEAVRCHASLLKIRLIISECPGAADGRSGKAVLSDAMLKTPECKSSNRDCDTFDQQSEQGCLVGLCPRHCPWTLANAFDLLNTGPRLLSQVKSIHLRSEASSQLVSRSKTKSSESYFQYLFIWSFEHA